MKDIKSYAIGFLTCACLFLIMGQTNNKNLGDITVSSIRLEGEDGQWYGSWDANALRIANGKTATVGLFNYELGGGIIVKDLEERMRAGMGVDENGGISMVFNKDEKMVAKMQALESGDGFSSISNKDGNWGITMGSNEYGGVFRIYNKHNQNVVGLTSNNKLHGAIYLMDKYGEFGWGRNGKNNN